MIEYCTGSLFDAPKEAVLTHACNARGKWGSGIAWEFRERFDEDYWEYQSFCRIWGHKAVGQALITKNLVGCLITSYDYGKNIDSEEQILSATEKALDSLLMFTDREIHMPKINSGLFRVPWEKTERIINSLVGNPFGVHYGRKIVVWTPET